MTLSAVGYSGAACRWNRSRTRKFYAEPPAISMAVQRSAASSRSLFADLHVIQFLTLKLHTAAKRHLRHRYLRQAKSANGTHRSPAKLLPPMDLSPLQKNNAAPSIPTPV